MAEIRTVAVLGAGTMGHGIAQVAAAAGFRVLLRDVSREFVEKGLAGIRRNLDSGLEKGKVTAAERERILANVRGVVDLAEAVREADLVIEAIPEDLELKRKTFAEVDRHAPAGAVLATNTSSLPVSAIAIHIHLSATAAIRKVRVFRLLAVLMVAVPAFILADAYLRLTT